MKKLHTEKLEDKHNTGKQGNDFLESADSGGESSTPQVLLQLVENLAEQTKNFAEQAKNLAEQAKNFAEQAENLTSKFFGFEACCSDDQASQEKVDSNTGKPVPKGFIFVNQARGALSRGNGEGSSSQYTATDHQQSSDSNHTSIFSANSPSLHHQQSSDSNHTSIFSANSTSSVYYAPLETESQTNNNVSDKSSNSINDTESTTSNSNRSFLTIASSGEISSRPDPIKNILPGNEISNKPDLKRFEQEMQHPSAQPKQGETGYVAGIKRMFEGFSKGGQ